jgi:integrase
LNALRKTLKPPAPLHAKRFHWVTLGQLDAIADACLTEGRQPYLTHPTTRSPGAQRAVRFQRGLILKLLVRVPLRQRNVREVQLDKHLYKDHEGWHLEFSGDDLKIGHRGEMVNTYEINLSDYCPEWTVLLEEWLAVHRPKLPNAAASRFVFLTMYGKPHIGKTLHADLSSAVAMRTGKRFYPHLIRSIWATEYLDTHPGDFAAVATMLGNTVAVVMRTYYNHVHKDQHVKAKAFLSTALRTG